MIIDATDNIKTRQVIDHISKTARIPMVYGGLYRFEGQVAVLNHNGGPGYEDIFTPDPAGGDTCAEAGVLGMLPAIIGNIQALEAVKIIIGIKPNLSGKLLVFKGSFHRIEIHCAKLERWRSDLRSNLVMNSLFSRTLVTIRK